MTKCSDLEYVVLGVVWKKGPVTPYAIRQEFLTSPTPHFSGSAGAIYPLVRRLERAELLVSEASYYGRTPSRKFRITRAGTAALRKWLRPPIPPADAAANFDPLRTRLYFLAALTPRQRRTFVDASVAALRAQLPILKSDEARYSKSEDIFSHLASQGIRRSIESRIKWLESVLLALEDAGMA